MQARTRIQTRTRMQARAHTHTHLNTPSVASGSATGVPSASYPSSVPKPAAAHRALLGRKIATGGARPEPTESGTAARLTRACYDWFCCRGAARAGAHAAPPLGRSIDQSIAATVDRRARKGDMPKGSNRQTSTHRRWKFRRWKFRQGANHPADRRRRWSCRNTSKSNGRPFLALNLSKQFGPRQWPEPCRAE